MCTKYEKKHEKRPKNGLLAFIATIHNNSPSFKLMYFLKIAAFMTGVATRDPKSGENRLNTGCQPLVI